MKQFDIKTILTSQTNAVALSMSKSRLFSFGGLFLFSKLGAAMQPESAKPLLSLDFLFSKLAVLFSGLKSRPMRLRSVLGWE